MDRALTITSLLLAGVAVAWAARTDARLEALSAERTEAAPAAEVSAAAEPTEEEAVELADLMRGLALRMSNLWYARAADDLALFDYEVREIEEIQEELEAAALMEAGRDVDGEVKRLVLKHIPALRGALESGDQAGYEKRYGRIVDGCNECHQATAHPFIRIGTPAGPQVGNRLIGPPEVAPADPPAP